MVEKNFLVNTDYAHLSPSPIANALLYFIYPMSVHLSSSFLMHFKISGRCYYI